MIDRIPRARNHALRSTAHSIRAFTTITTPECTAMHRRKAELFALGLRVWVLGFGMLAPHLACHLQAQQHVPRDPNTERSYRTSLIFVGYAWSYSACGIRHLVLFGSMCPETPNAERPYRTRVKRTSRLPAPNAQAAKSREPNPAAPSRIVPGPNMCLSRVSVARAHRRYRSPGSGTLRPPKP
jgi:hypothetical protein